LLIILSIFIKIKIPNKKDVIWLILAGFFGFFFYIIVFNIGSITVSAATASLILATSPIITTILARIFFNEKLKIIQYIAIVIQFIGVGFLTLLNGIFSINSGLLWIILASLSNSIYYIIQRKLTKKYPAIQVSIFGIWVGTILLMIFLPVSITEVKNAPLMQIINLIILGVFSSAIAYLTWTYAIKKAKNISSVTNYIFLTPFITTILGFLLANEIPDFTTIVGGIIIIIGMFIYYFYDIIIKRTGNKKYVA